MDMDMDIIIEKIHTSLSPAGMKPSLLYSDPVAFPIHHGISTSSQNDRDILLFLMWSRTRKTLMTDSMMMMLRDRGRLWGERRSCRLLWLSRRRLRVWMSIRRFWKYIISWVTLYLASSRVRINICIMLFVNIDEQRGPGREGLPGFDSGYQITLPFNLQSKLV